MLECLLGILVLLRMIIIQIPDREIQWINPQGTQQLQRWIVQWLDQEVAQCHLLDHLRFLLTHAHIQDRQEATTIDLQILTITVELSVLPTIEVLAQVEEVILDTPMEELIQEPIPLRVDQIIHLLTAPLVEVVAEVEWVPEVVAHLEVAGVLVDLVPEDQEEEEETNLIKYKNSTSL